MKCMEMCSYGGEGSTRNGGACQLAPRHGVPPLRTMALRATAPSPETRSTIHRKTSGGAP